jgi:hypothetical protein
LGRPVLAFSEAESPRSKRPKDSLKVESFRSRVHAITPINVFATLEDFKSLLAGAVSKLRERVMPEADGMKTGEAGQGASDDSSSRSASPDNLAGADQVDRVTSDRPLVFISSSHKDMEWRQLLEQALDDYREDIEWWDTSKLAPGANWRAEIDAMQSRAQLAVLLLSAHYLASRNAIAEMAALRSQSKSGRPTLFPVVVRQCDWQDVPEIREIQVWNQGRPLELLGASDRKNEFRNIAASILRFVGKTPAHRAQILDGRVVADEIKREVEAEVRRVTQSTTPADSTSSPKLRFSSNAQAVMDMARSLASQSKRELITSSCLLFGFTNAATSRNDSARLVRDMISRTGQYASAFDDFMTDAGKPQAFLAIDSIGKVSRNVGAVLEYATTIASQVSGSDEIHQRHLLAALLSLPGRKGQLKAHKRLKEIGIERPQYLSELLGFIRLNTNENLDEWAKILGSSSTLKTDTETESQPFLEGPAGYTAEFCGVGGKRTVADYLFVGTHADRLAELIALRETKLPLAIGLFGNWGSGKSHFMNLMDRRLKALMESEKQRPLTSKPKWCREIVPIYFNAWHYLDANLWASLVAQIFESLFAHLSPRGDDLERVQQLLENASGAAARAAEELTIAENATKQAEKDLSSAKESRRQAETVFDGLLHGLKSLLPQVTPTEIQRQTVELLGIEKEVITIDDLREVVEEANSLGARIQVVFKKLWKQPGRGWRLAWLLVVALGGAAIAGVVAMYLPGLKGGLQPFGQSVAALLGAVSALMLWLTPLLVAAKKHFKKLEDWANKAETERQRLAETDDVKQAKLKFGAAAEKEQAARKQLAEAETRETQLKEEARSLSPGRKLGRYIEQRAQSADYRGQLGLVSLARRDFQELSNLFADADALEERVARLRAEQAEKQAEMAKSRAAQTEEHEEQAKQIETAAKDIEEQVKALQELSRSIDRIVLFVDDLDRCQPEKIVEILQAVHLLLAFPLFAVVVGVDQRALRQSLQAQFTGLLAPDAIGKRIKAYDNQRPATPLDYLEKIFHVPFHLPVMGKDGFAELMSKLSEPPREDSKSESEEKDDGRSPQPSELITGKLPAAAATLGEIGAETIPAKEKPKVGFAQDTLPARVSQTQPVPTEMIGSVPLQDWERKALAEYYSLIHTPRGATRLLNTYRLVRAGVPRLEWDIFSRGGEYRVAMLLLAAAAGYPATVRDWFDELLKDDTGLLDAGEDTPGAQPGWSDFKLMYQESFANGAEGLTKDVFAKWIERVQRFTF